MTPEKKDIKVNKALRERVVSSLKMLGFLAPTNFGLTSARDTDSIFIITPHNMSKDKVTKALSTEFGKKDGREKDHFSVNILVGNRLEVNLALEYEFIVNTEEYKLKQQGQSSTAKNDKEKKEVRPKGKEEEEESTIPSGEADQENSARSIPRLNGEKTFSVPELIKQGQEPEKKPFARPIIPLTDELLNETIIRAGNMTLGEFLNNHCRLVSKGEINIYWTGNSNYRSQIQGNRIKKVNKIKAIKESYVIDGQLFSISIFNEFLEEIDAQHRNEASFDSSLGIYFVIMPGYALPEVKVYNAILSAWTPTERMISFADEGNPNYILFKKFFDANPFNISTCQLLLISRRSRKLGKNKYAILDDEFLGGSFEVTDEQVALAEERVLKIKRFKMYHALGWNSRDFVEAFLKISAMEGFVFDELIGKFELEPNTVLMNAKAQKSDFYITELLKIYNDGRPRSKWLIYTAKK